MRIQAFDPEEVAAYMTSGQPLVAVRFAHHVRERDPTEIWAPLTLAEHAGSPEERVEMLWEAVRTGTRRWSPEWRQRQVDWFGEPETRPFLMVLYALAQQSAVMVRAADAAWSVKTLLRLDPQDRMGAEAILADTGIIPEAEAEKAAGMLM